MINGIGSGYYGGYPAYTGNTAGVRPSEAVGTGASADPVQAGRTAGTIDPVQAGITAGKAGQVPAGKIAAPVPTAQPISPYAVTNEQEAREAGLSEGQIRGLKKAGQIECATCAGRMYQDGSDENVSFKSAAHVSPTAAGAAVRAHEGEHVSNAYKKAAMNNGKVVHAGVSIHMAICRECGRSYVSGGTTHTTIKYYENNPYGANAKSYDRAAGIAGRSVDVGV